MRLPALLFVAALGLAACAPGVTIDEAYGRPDATTWSYFEGSPSAVVNAIGQHLSNERIRIESMVDEAGGVVLTLSAYSGSMDTARILVQPTAEEGFRSRAQAYPSGRALPRGLERAIESRL
jgi:hypothetical protein